MFLNKTTQGQSKWVSTVNHGYTDVIISPTVGVNPGYPAVYGSNRKIYDMKNYQQNTSDLTSNVDTLNLSAFGWTVNNNEYSNRGQFDIVNWCGGTPNTNPPGSGTPTGEVTQTSTLITGLPHTFGFNSGNVEEGEVRTWNVHNPMHETPFTIYGSRNRLSIPTADQRAYAHFGASVAIGMNKIFVGAPGARPTTPVSYSGTDPLPSTVRWSGANATGAAQGCVYVYNYKGEYLHQFNTGTYEASEFGASVAVSPGSVWIGSPGNPATGGAAYYERYAAGRVVVYNYDIDNDYETPDTGHILRPGTHATWDYQLNQPGDRFGEVIKIIGDKAYISAPGTNDGIGSVYIFSTQNDRGYGTRKFIGEIAPPLSACRDENGAPTVSGFGRWIEGDGTHLFVGCDYSTPSGRIFVYDIASGQYVTNITMYNDTDGASYPSMGRSSDHYFTYHGGTWSQRTMEFGSSEGMAGLNIDSTNTRQFAQNCTNRNFVIAGFENNSTGDSTLQVFANSRSLTPKDALTLDGGNRWRKYTQSIQDTDWQRVTNLGG